MEAANTRLAAFSAPGEDRHGGRDRRRSRLRRRDDPLRPRHRRRPGEARAVARHHRRLDPGAGARGRARRRRDVRHRAGDQGPDPAAEPGRRRRRSRGRGARPARALGVASCWRCRSTSGSAGSTRRSPTSCPRPSAPRSPASSSARKAAIAMARLDTATLRQATEDVRDFGVVVSETDADRIERANAAISRLGLIWRGLSNQLAVAAAPALEAVANAMAAARPQHRPARDRDPRPLRQPRPAHELCRHLRRPPGRALGRRARRGGGLGAAASPPRWWCCAARLIRTGIGALSSPPARWSTSSPASSPAPAASARRCRSSATWRPRSGSGSSRAATPCRCRCSRSGRGSRPAG